MGGRVPFHPDGDTIVSATLTVDERGVVSPSLESLVRWSGLLGLAAGALIAASVVVHPSDDQLSSAGSAWVAIHLPFYIGLLFTLLLLVGAFLRQYGPGGQTGIIGFLVAFAGTALMLLDGREHLFLLPLYQTHLPEFAATPPGLAQLIVTSLIFSVGYIIFGVSLIRARVLPRGAGLLLALGAPLLAFAPPIGLQGVSLASGLLFGGGLAWLGFGLWQRGRRPGYPGASTRTEVTAGPSPTR
jgi:hypothetical protein